MQILNVDLGERSYPIYIGSGLLGNPDYITSHIHGKQVMVVTNETVAPLYLKSVLKSLEGYKVAQVILPDGEQYKNLEVLNMIYTALLENRFDRRCTLIALGGGVVGDMTGFAAASYQRGVNFIQIPTTLLAQVDSSVGGKTGVNHSLGKNMIGAFHQPQCVIADTDTLNTLDDRQLSAGISEVIKYGLINDLSFFEWLEENIQSMIERDPDLLSFAIHRSCEDKAEVVAADELESGSRALLNLGHTFGHAIETGMGYGEWLHGEAVAVGMVMAAELSEAMGWIDSETTTRIRTIIQESNLPTTAPKELSVEQFIALMSVDKKVLDGELRLVLMRQLGNSTIEEGIPIETLKSMLANHLSRGDH